MIYAEAIALRYHKPSSTRTGERGTHGTMVLCHANTGILPYRHDPAAAMAKLRRSLT